MIKLLKQFRGKKAGLELVVFFFLGLASQGYGEENNAAEKATVCFMQSCFYPEVARVQSQKQRGLMEREKLPEQGGMIFIYENETRPLFWMKNMRIPLDFIWLDRWGKVVDIRENVPECRIANCPTLESAKPAQYVLEISAGATQKNRIRMGDEAKIQLRNFT